LNFRSDAVFPPALHIDGRKQENAHGIPLPDKRSHRGPHPEDSQLFGESALPTLREAAGQCVWLFDRGYPPTATLKLVGDRHRLTQRQRIAVARCCCSRGQFDVRLSHRLPPDGVGGSVLLLDGYNALTTVEAALSGGVVLLARDGCYRDMASMHGTFRKVQETVPALKAIGLTLEQLQVAKTHWYLDSPVSNSGRLATVIRELAQQHGWPWEVELVLDPDGVLAKAHKPVATADSGILDRCRRWLNLVQLVIDRHVPEAWIVDFIS
jgi:hypothetical protein